jgi:hypothetical protein
LLREMSGNNITAKFPEPTIIKLTDIVAIIQKRLFSLDEKFKLTTPITFILYLTNQMNLFSIKLF